MSTLKKIKIETQSPKKKRSPRKTKIGDFNILKTLYLDGENRDILSVVRKLISKDTKMKITRSFIEKTNRRKTTICECCFSITKNFRALNCGLKNTQRTEYPIFCEKCWANHFNRYTEIEHVGYKKNVFIDHEYISEVKIDYNHKCPLKEFTSQRYFSTVRELEYIRQHGDNINLGELLFSK